MTEWAACGPRSLQEAWQQCIQDMRQAMIRRRSDLIREGFTIDNGQAPGGYRTPRYNWIVEPCLTVREEALMEAVLKVIQQGPSDLILPLFSVVKEHYHDCLLWEHK